MGLVYPNIMSLFLYLVLPWEICMPELGCFKYVRPFLNTGIPRILPYDRKIIDTKFYLYTPQDHYRPLTFSNFNKNISRILKSSYKPNATTNFVVGGFMSGAKAEWKKLMVDALIKYKGRNVFLVDWDKGDDEYNSAVANTRVVGAEIALFIHRLQNVTGLEPKNVHIIGHSLGAHIAGFAGKRLKGLGRITGLDPAGPAFTDVNPKERLDKSDALFVDVIHTDMSSNVLKGFGLAESIGHFDFFPNGGHNQPGCEDLGSFVLSFIKNPTNPKSYPGIECNHSRAQYLFISSIRNTKCKLWSTICGSWRKYLLGACRSCRVGRIDNCLPLGIDAERYAWELDSNESFNLYLKTTAKEPFC